MVVELLLIQVKSQLKPTVIKISIPGCRRDWAVMYNTLWPSGGFVHMVLTRGQTGLTQVTLLLLLLLLLLLRDADVWAGPAKCVFNNTAAECRGRCLTSANAWICALHTRRLP